MYTVILNQEAGNCDTISAFSLLISRLALPIHTRNTKSMSFYRSEKEYLLNTLLRWMVILGGIAYVPSVIASVKMQLYGLAAVDTAVYLFLALIFISPGSGFRLRLFSSVSGALLIGAVVLFATGTEGAGHVWLLFAVFIAALFGSNRYSVIVVAATQAVMVSFCILNYLGIIDQPGSVVAMIAISSNMLLISITISLITTVLLRALQREIDSQEGTLRLLHHRVKNNLQSIQSLVSIAGQPGAETDHLGRRIEAVAEANKLLLADSRRASVSLSELLRLIAPAGQTDIEETESGEILPEQLNEIAVGFSDLFYLLREADRIRISLNEKIEIVARFRTEALKRIDESRSDLLIPPGWLQKRIEKDGAIRLSFTL